MVHHSSRATYSPAKHATDFHHISIIFRAIYRQIKSGDCNPQSHPFWRVNNYTNKMNKIITKMIRILDFSALHGKMQLFPADKFSKYKFHTSKYKFHTCYYSYYNAKTRRTYSPCIKLAEKPHPSQCTRRNTRQVKGPTFLWILGTGV